MNHLIHGSLRSDRSNAPDILESQVGHISRGLQFFFEAVEVGVRNVAENTRKGGLNERVDMKLDHLVSGKVLYHFVQVTGLVVGNYPATAPPRHTIELRERTNCEERDVLAKFGK